MLDTVLPALLVAPIVAALVWPHGALLGLVAASLSASATVLVVAVLKVCLSSRTLEPGKGASSENDAAGAPAADPHPQRNPVQQQQAGNRVRYAASPGRLHG